MSLQIKQIRSLDGVVLEERGRLIPLLDPIIRSGAAVALAPVAFDVDQASRPILEVTIGPRQPAGGRCRLVAEVGAVELFRSASDFATAEGQDCRVPVLAGSPPNGFIGLRDETVTWKLIDAGTGHPLDSADVRMEIYFIGRDPWPAATHGTPVEHLRNTLDSLRQQGHGAIGLRDRRMVLGELTDPSDQIAAATRTVWQHSPPQYNVVDGAWGGYGIVSLSI